MTENEIRTKGELHEAMQKAATRIAILKGLVKECPFDSNFKTMLAEEEAHFKNIVTTLAIIPAAIAA